MNQRKDGVHWSVRRLSFFGLGLFAAIAVFRAPASLLTPALDRAGANISYEAVSGTLWSGRIEAVSASGVYVGDIDYALRPLGLLRGALTADIQAAGGFAVGEGRVSLSLLGRKAEIRNAKTDVNLSAIRQYSLFGIPYGGRLRTDIKRAAWSMDNGCDGVEGDIWTDVLDASSRQFVGDGLVLAGPAACDGDSLTVALAGANQAGQTQISIAVSPSFTYQVTARVVPDRAELGGNLRRLGFEDSNGALVYDAVGAIKGAGT